MWADFLSFLGLLLTVVALVLTLYQLYCASRQARVLETIAQSQSTRYLGTLAEYLPFVVKVIESARDRLEICTGTSLHGILTDHSGWRDHHAALVRSFDSENLKVDITCSDKNNRERLAVFQFKDKSEEAWNIWKGNSDVKKKLDTVIKSHGLEKQYTIETLTRDQFTEILCYLTEVVIKADYHGRNLIFTQCSTFIMNYFWIADRREAVFAFLCQSSDAVAHGFYTSDPRLISALLELKDNYNRRFSITDEFDSKNLTGDT